MNNYFYIHSDFTSYCKLKRVKDTISNFSSYEAFIQSALINMYSNIEDYFGSNYILPTYNYDFPQKKKFYVKKDKGQTGIFSEFCRLKRGFYRSHLPIFSSISKNINNLKFINHDTKLNPFDKYSDLGILHKNNGSLVNFGSKFSPTFIHYIENELGSNLLYRYKKSFLGNIYLNNKLNYEVELIFNVRPFKLDIKYDLIKIKKDLLKEGLLKNKFFEKKINYQIINSSDFYEYVIYKIKKDPYYLIDNNSKLLLKKEKLWYKKLKYKDFEHV